MLAAVSLSAHRSTLSPTEVWSRPTGCPPTAAIPGTPGHLSAKNCSLGSSSTLGNTKKTSRTKDSGRT